MPHTLSKKYQRPKAGYSRQELLDYLTDEIDHVRQAGTYPEALPASQYGMLTQIQFRMLEALADQRTGGFSSRKQEARALGDARKDLVKEYESQTHAAEFERAATDILTALEGPKKAGK